MSYCLAFQVYDGLVMLSDTRTNAGPDDISTFGKLHVLEEPGERVIGLLSAGNLAVTQAVVHAVSDGLPGEHGTESLRDVPTLFRAAELVGAAIRRVYHSDGPTLQAQQVSFDVSFLLGGQISGQPMRLFRIYAAGNFIEATADTPFLQIGEHKYGKPILDRALAWNTNVGDAIKLALISMDSTLRSNLTVGMPIDLLVVPTDGCRVGVRRRITDDDAYFRMIRERWSAALRAAHQAIPPPDWLG